MPLRNPPVPTFRAAPPVRTRVNQLGPLADLTGHWLGHGFNLIARPGFDVENDIFLQLSPTDEEIRFEPIGGVVPNRGFKESDIQIFGLHYLQRINDHSTGGALHLEPGLWLYVEQNDETQKPTVVRSASIPHGTAVLGEGSEIPPVDGGPIIQPANTVPFQIGAATPAPGTPNPFPEYDLSTPNQFRTNPTPAGVTQALVTDPNSLLTNDIAGQKITRTIVLDVASSAPAALDIPFLGPNAAVAGFNAIFWIETVEGEDGEYLQLQYTQTVLLNFNGLTWPHVSAATLLKVS